MAVGSQVTDLLRQDSYLIGLCSNLVLIFASGFCIRDLPHVLRLLVHFQDYKCQVVLLSLLVSPAPLIQTHYFLV